MNKTPKITDVLKKARECLEAGRFYDTTHAVLRKQQRALSLTHISYVIRNGYHEKRKDQYKPEHFGWTYAIRGLTVDGKDIRVAIAFDEQDMLIITVIALTKGSR